MTVRNTDAPPPRGDKFRVIIVGAGIGGLLASIGLALDGHQVVVLEQASSFGEVGAGMRIPPNSFKILNRWGVDLTYMKKTYSNGNRFLRYDDGSVLADMPHGIPEWDFGGSYLMVHRADYHQVLLDKALSLGVELRPASKVVSYDWDAPAAVLSAGVRVEGDLLVVADGRSRSSSPKPPFRRNSKLAHKDQNRRLTKTPLSQESRAARARSSRATTCSPSTPAISRTASSSPASTCCRTRTCATSCPSPGCRRGAGRTPT